MSSIIPFLALSRFAPGDARNPSSMIATASGLSKSSLFAHFRSKEHLQAELLDEMADAESRVIVESIHVFGGEQPLWQRR
jgi:AcrR family transcriptional regulator